MIRLKRFFQWLFLVLYFSMLGFVVYLGASVSTPGAESISKHPLETILKKFSTPAHEPWKEAFMIGMREVFPVYQNGEEPGDATGFAYVVPGSGEARPVELLLCVDMEGKVISVIPIKINAPFGFAEEFEQQNEFFESFRGRKDLEIMPFDEGGMIPTVTGAAILSRQVIYAVREGVEFFLANRDAFLRAVRPAAAPDDNAVSVSEIEKELTPEVENTEAPADAAP